MKNKGFRNDYGLLNAKRADKNAENAPLWSLELYLLSKDENILITIENYIYLNKTDIEGLYNQLPEKEAKFGSNDSYMSPDQLIAFVGTLYLLGRKRQVYKIWKYLLTHFFTYDNIGKKTNIKKIQQPASIFFVGACSGNVICKMLLPIVIVISMISSPSKTSGKLKSWTMFKVLNMKITEKIADYIISKNKYNKSWYEVFKTYFYEEGHPIIIELEKK